MVTTEPVTGAVWLHGPLRKVFCRPQKRQKTSGSGKHVNGTGWWHRQNILKQDALYTQEGKQIGNSLVRSGELPSMLSSHRNGRFPWGSSWPRGSSFRADLIQSEESFHHPADHLPLHRLLPAHPPWSCSPFPLNLWLQPHWSSSSSPSVWSHSHLKAWGGLESDWLDQFVLKNTD